MIRQSHHRVGVDSRRCRSARRSRFRRLLADRRTGRRGRRWWRRRCTVRLLRGCVVRSERFRWSRTFARRGRRLDRTAADVRRARRWRGRCCPRGASRSRWCRPPLRRTCTLRDIPPVIRHRDQNCRVRSKRFRRRSATLPSTPRRPSRLREPSAIPVGSRRQRRWRQRYRALAPREQ